MSSIAGSGSNQRDSQPLRNQLFSNENEDEDRMVYNMGEEEGTGGFN